MQEQEDVALKQNQNITNQEFKLVIKQKTGRNEQKVVTSESAMTKSTSQGQRTKSSTKSKNSVVPQSHIQISKPFVFPIIKESKADKI